MNNSITPPQISKETIINAPVVLCENCGNSFFEEKLLFKKVSALLSPTGKAELFPLQVVVCTKCQLISSDFNPQKLIPEQYLAKKKVVMQSNEINQTNNLKTI